MSIMRAVKPLTDARSLLPLAIICSYAPQILRLRYHASDLGLSPIYLLRNTLFSTAQLSDMIFSAAYIWPGKPESVVDLISNGRLKGVKAFGGILGLLQISAQWACSVAV